MLNTKTTSIKEQTSDAVLQGGQCVCASVFFPPEQLITEPKSHIFQLIYCLVCKMSEGLKKALADILKLHVSPTKYSVYYHMRHAKGAILHN